MSRKDINDSLLLMTADPLLGGHRKNRPVPWVLWFVTITKPIDFFCVRRGRPQFTNDFARWCGAYTWWRGTGRMQLDIDKNDAASFALCKGLLNLSLSFVVAEIVLPARKGLVHFIRTGTKLPSRFWPCSTFDREQGGV